MAASPNKNGYLVDPLDEAEVLEEYRSMTMVAGAVSAEWVVAV